MIGYRESKYNSYLYGTFKNPAAFRPDLPPTTVMPPPIPAHPTTALLWLLFDEQAIAARPWFPSLEEQDAAFWAVHGEAIMRYRQNRHNARAMAEMAVGIESRDGTVAPIPTPPRSVERQAALAGRLFGTRGGVEFNRGAVEKQ